MKNKLLIEIKKIKKMMFMKEQHDEEYFRPTLTDEEKRNTVQFVGRNITWFGTPERSGIIPIDKIDNMWGNITYPEKIDNLKSIIENSDENIELATAYCHPHIINILHVRDEQIAKNEGSFETDFEGTNSDPASTGDEELDLYLSTYDYLDEIDEYFYITDNSKKFFKKYHTEIGTKRKNEDEVIKEFQMLMQGEEESEYETELNESFQNYLQYEHRLLEAIENQYGDIGDMRFQMRDGNHRFMVAKEIGERYILCDIGKDFDIEEVKRFIKVI